MDLGFSGPKFTWYNNQQGSAWVWECIDQAFAIVSRVQCFPNYQVRNLPRIASDHYPIILSIALDISCQSPFQFEKFFMAYPHSWDIMWDMWRLSIRDSVIYQLTYRLEIPHCRLGRCNRVEVGSIVRSLEEVETSISVLQVRKDREGGYQLMTLQISEPGSPSTISY